MTAAPNLQIHIKARKGSALEGFILMRGQEGGAGISERMHTLVERYDAMLDAVPATWRLGDKEVAQLAEALKGWPLPPANRIDFRSTVMSRAASHGAPHAWEATKSLVDRLQTMSLAALILAVETAERGA